jgi:putative tryptophan/tyrosine transport system substrate-binding protein
VKLTIARLTLVALLLLAVALAAGAQGPGKVRIGYLSGNPPPDTRDALAGFWTKLRELGYVEGDNLIIDLRYANGRYELLPDLAADLVRLKVDLIFSYGTPGSLAAKSTTSTIPIVFSGVADPLGVGLVSTVARPGANVTGVMSNNPELTAKRMSLLKEIVPGPARVAVLTDPDFKPTANMLRETTFAARSLGMELQVVEARTRQVVEVGGLISYGVDYLEAFQQAGVLVEKILKGAKPADLPVEEPWRFALVINLKTERALGLTIPPSLVLRAERLPNIALQRTGGSRCSHPGR